MAMAAVAVYAAGGVERRQRRFEEAKEVEEEGSR
jgi:hypothetical protein